MTIQEIGQRMTTQDNLATDHPIFVVEQQDRVYGVSGEWGENGHCYYRDGDMVEEIPECDEDEDADEWKASWERVAYKVAYRFVSAFFTSEAARDYIKANSHNLENPRVYCYGSYRNEEWRVVSDAITATAVAPLVTPDPRFPEKTGATEPHPCLSCKIRTARPGDDGYEVGYCEKCATTARTRR